MSTILHIPHASTIIPEDCMDDFCISDEEINSELLQMTDWFTDELYTSSNNTDVVRIEAPISRLCCDMERFREDAGEEMSKVGMGAIYTHGSRLQRIKNSTPGRREELLKMYYDLYHRKLYDAVTESLTQIKHCLIVDCHSFQTEVRPYEIDTSRKRPQICIGTHPAHTPPEVIECISSWALLHGYSVAIDEPYAGTLVPLPYFEKDLRVKSVMLEIRRDLYMDERIGKKNHHFDILCGEVRSLIDELSCL